MRNLLAKGGAIVLPPFLSVIYYRCSADATQPLHGEFPSGELNTTTKRRMGSCNLRGELQPALLFRRSDMDVF